MQGKGWPLPRENEGTTNWLKVGVRRQSGMFLFIMSTAWWAYSIETEEEWNRFDEVVEDVEWVIGQVTCSLKQFPRPIQPTQPISSKKSKSSASYMVRKTGKRQPKLTRKLLEAAEA
jgi:hypothetical protein